MELPQQNSSLVTSPSCTKFGRVIEKIHRSVAKLKPKLVQPVIESLSILNCVHPSADNAEHNATAKKMSNALETGKILASFFFSPPRHSRCNFDVKLRIICPCCYRDQSRPCHFEILSARCIFHTPNCCLSPIRLSSSLEIGQIQAIARLFKGT